MVKVHYSLGLLSMLKGKKEKIEFNLKFKRCSNPRLSLQQKFRLDHKEMVIYSYTMDLSLMKELQAVF